MHELSLCPKGSDHVILRPGPSKSQALGGLLDQVRLRRAVPLVLKEAKAPMLACVALEAPLAPSRELAAPLQEPSDRAVPLGRYHKRIHLAIVMQVVHGHALHRTLPGRR